MAELYRVAALAGGLTVLVEAPKHMRPEGFEEASYDEAALRAEVIFNEMVAKALEGSKDVALVVDGKHTSNHGKVFNKLSAIRSALASKEQPPVLDMHFNQAELTLGQKAARLVGLRPAPRVISCESYVFDPKR